MKKIETLAKIFEYKINKYAQQMSAQPYQVEKIMRDAGFFKPEVNQAVGALLTQTKVADGVDVTIRILALPGFKIDYELTSNSPNFTPQQSQYLKKMLIQKYSAGMSAALKKSGLNITDSVSTGWLEFT